MELVELVEAEVGVGHVRDLEPLAVTPHLCGSSRHVRGHVRHVRGHVRHVRGHVRHVRGHVTCSSSRLDVSFCPTVYGRKLSFTCTISATR
eukprot:6750271-Prymnesium_polylepis.1